MKKIFLLFAPIIICLSATDAGAQTGTLLKAKQEIVLITAVKTKGKDLIIDADFVQMLTGKAAVDAAKKNRRSGVRYQ